MFLESNWKMILNDEMEGCGRKQFWRILSCCVRIFLEGLKRKQEVLKRTNLPNFLALFKNVICIKTSVCPNITLVGSSVPILKHSHIPNYFSNKRIVGSS
jgi:hypothetical protein